MGQLKSENLRISAVVFIIAYSIVPFISQFVSTYLTTYSYMALSVLVVLLIIMERRKESLDEVFANIAPFLAYGVLTYFTKTDSLVLWGYNLLRFLMPVIIGVYTLRYYENECKIYTRVIVLCIVVTSITTAIGLETLPGASRWLAVVSKSDDPHLIMCNRKNIGGYGFVYTMVLMYPLLVLAYKKGKISLFKTVLISAIIFSCLILAEYTISLLLFIATTCLFFMKKDLKPRDVTIFFIIVTVVMLVFSTAASNLLRDIALKVESENVAARLNDLAGGAAGLQRSEDKRLDLYMMSVNTFFTHPFGTFLSGGRGTGGHSFILDALGHYGIFGLVVVIYMYRKLYQMLYKRYRGQEDFGYIVWIIAQAILLSTLNTGMWEEILAFYAPVVLSVLYGNSDKKSITQGAPVTQDDIGKESKQL